MDYRGICLMLAVVLWVCLTPTAESLECLTCTNVLNVSDCRTFSTCQPDEQCFTKTTSLEKQVVFSLGCRSAAQCLGSTTQSSIYAIVERDITDRSASTECDQCCSVEFCNRKLCNHEVDVDGKLSSWLSWSNCDVTCGHGHRSRIRTCTEPSPSHGGLDCSGASTDNDNCALNPCPIHGGWSLWSAWGSCSVTCGVGLMRRDRTCSNPCPDMNGDHCFGDSRDDRACFERACADGGWSQWHAWGSCSASCGGGFKTRSRTCSNPPPSQLGKNCEGNNEDKELCNTKPCPVPMVAFTAHSPTGQLVGDSVPSFIHIVENSGGGYNKSTGVFTCTVPGLYHFQVNLLVRPYSGSGYTFCTINAHNNLGKDAIAFVQTGKSMYLWASASIYLRLSAAVTVDLQCTGWTFIDHNSSTIFTGALITQD